ncbi:MAG: InlB B-repeat-containing protein [Leptospirales bacterium]|nr:InlB B-repeat-containing protein [Leptospirales bacterium]
MKNILKKYIILLIIGLSFLACNNLFLGDSWDEDTSIKRSYFTVTFDARVENLALENQIITSGGKVSKIDPISKEGFGFAGWYTDKDKLWDFATDIVTSDITLHAEWSRFLYSVKFEANGGTPAPDEQILAEGAKVVEPAPMSKAGSSFGGWYSDVDCTKLWDFTTVPMSTANFTLYAKWSNYIIKFEANGGTPAPKDQILAEGAKIVEPAPMDTPIGKSDHGFGGWYTDVDCTKLWDFTTAISNGTNIITLYAKWVTPGYSVTFEADGGSPPPGQQRIAYDGKVTKVQPMNKGSDSFVGWYKEPGYINLWDFATDTVKSNITLYAKWSHSSYNVKFEANGGTPAPNDQILAEGAKVVEPAPMSKAGSSFGGWYSDAACTNPWDFTTAPMSTADFTLYAKWESLYDCIVTFESYGGNPPPENQLLFWGAKIVEPVAMATPMGKSNHGFGGWYSDAAYTKPWDFTTDTISSGVKDIALYAKWVTPGWSVTFKADGGSPPPGQQRIADGGKVTKVQPMNKGSDSFVGWYKEPGYINLWDFATDTVTSDITLYAKWSHSSYNVKFEANGGTPAPNDQILAEGAKIVEPAPMATPIDKPNHCFGGWYSDEACTKLWDFTTPISNGTNMITLYAKWESLYDCTVTFDSDGGNPSPGKQLLFWGTKIVEPVAMTKTSYGFGGWYSDAARTKPWDFTTDTISNGVKEIILYANWVIDTYTIKFEADGGNPAPQDQIVAYGDKVTQPPIMTKRYFIFMGWYKDSGLTDEWNFEVHTVNANMTLYAKWEDADYRVTFDANGGLFDVNGVLSDRQNQGTIIGEKISEPRAPERDKFGFDGWYLDNGTFTQLWDFDTDTVTIDGHMTLYAKWVDDTDPDMVWVPPGSYMMGDNSITGAKPAHKVKMSGFYIGRYPVTQEKYLGRRGYNPSSFSPGGNPQLLERPVEKVTWYDAVMFCNELSGYDGLTKVYKIDNIETTTSGGITYISKADVTVIDWNNNGYRLPTEAEWEYAARGGNGSPENYTYSGSNDPDEVAWYNQNSSSQTHPVGGKKPNGLGIYDMSGNVSEWCWDWFDAGYYNISPLLNPPGPTSGAERIRRGGNWNNAAATIRPVARTSYIPAPASLQSNWVVGFRIVRRP